MTRPCAPGLLDWAWAGSALEEPSGDRHVVVAFPHGALVALIDGLGHGPEAAAAARAAAATIEADAGAPVDELLHRCHDGMRKTRGAAVTLASFNARAAAMTWTGVGNVDGALLRVAAGARRSSEAITLRGGVVGYLLPPLHLSTLAVEPGDTLVLATDGIRGGFTAGLRLDRSPDDIAHAILQQFAKGNDDAHVVVACYRGNTA